MDTVEVGLVWQYRMLSFAKNKKTAWQFFNYALIGLLSNLAGYSLYIFFTHFGLTPKFTMTALYAIGATVGYYTNRRFTFRHEGSISTSGLRFLAAHAIGYLVNLAFLLFFVDFLGFAHHLVQAVAIVAVASLLFLLFKFFVFPQKKSAS